jgi:hypothetical protein
VMAEKNKNIKDSQMGQVTQKKLKKSLVWQDFKLYFYSQGMDNGSHRKSCF